MSSYFEIGKRTYQRCHSVNIKKGRKLMTSIATIKFPNVKALLTDENKKIKVGDKVEISLGYDGNNNLEFTGYVSEIKPTVPITIECQDEMWKMKQESYKKTFKNTDLRDVVKDIAGSYEVDVTACPVNKCDFVFSNTTKYRALEKIKEEFNIDIYFRDKKLYVGLAYMEKGRNRVVYHFQKNAPTIQQQTGLIFKRKEDVKIKVRGISMLPDNKKHTVDVGDEDGEIHTLHYFNLTKEDLKKQCEAKVDTFKYDGYRGKLKAFGIPVVEHGDVAVLKDGDYPERGGDFFVDEVEQEYGPTSGYKKTIELGRSAKG